MAVKYEKKPFINSTENKKYEYDGGEIETSKLKIKVRGTQSRYDMSSMIIIRVHFYNQGDYNAETNKYSYTDGNYQNISIVPYASGSEVNYKTEEIDLDNNYIKSILYGRGKDLNDRNVWCDDPENKHINALMINKECINDSYIRDRIRRSIQKRVDMLKTGKISVNGNDQIAIGEPIIQLEGMFGLKPKGLLHSGEFFIEYWRKIGADKVAAFRSPMSCKQNAKVMNICNRDEVIKWYGNLKNIIVFNAWDTTMSAMNGED